MAVQLTFMAQLQQNIHGILLTIAQPGQIQTSKSVI